MGRRYRKTATGTYKTGITSVAYSPDGDTIITGSMGDKSFLWRTCNGKENKELFIKYYPLLRTIGVEEL